MSYGTVNTSLKLFLWGPARLEHGTREVKLRRKGLAILYYLALEGPTRREALADLLWGHVGASRNLRVELHRLRQVLAKLGYIAFPSGEALVKLPAPVQLDKTPGGGMVMEGLEDLSSEFQLWLEGQRSRWSAERSPVTVRKELIRALAEEVHPPFLLLLKGQPGSESGEFVHALARALGLPYYEGLRGGGRALRHLSWPYPPNAAERILKDGESVWAVEVPAYGEDPRFVLELRSHWPPEQMRYVTLPPLTWREARQRYLKNFPPAEAARLYLFMSGNPIYLREATAMYPKRLDGELPLPQRVRATVQLEERFLSLDARIALERLSVHPGPLSEGLLAAFDARPYLEEMERRGHLVFDRQWRFADESARRIIYAALQPGRRQRYHQRAAQQLAVEGKRVAEAYHLLCANEPVDWESVRHDLPLWARLSLDARLNREPTGATLPLEPFGVGPELALLEARRPSGEQGVSEGHIAWVRTPVSPRSSEVEWQLPDEPCLVQVRGHAHLENPLGVGLSGDAVPLKLEFLGRHSRTVVLAPTGNSHLLDEGDLLLPLSEAFEYWFYTDAHWGVRVTSVAEAAVFELEFAIHRTVPPRAAASKAVEAVSLPAVPLAEAGYGAR